MGPSLRFEVVGGRVEVAVILFVWVVRLGNQKMRIPGPGPIFLKPGHTNTMINCYRVR